MPIHVRCVRSAHRRSLRSPRARPATPARRLVLLAAAGLGILLLGGALILLRASRKPMAPKTTVALARAPSVPAPATPAPGAPGPSQPEPAPTQAQAETSPPEEVPLSLPRGTANVLGRVVGWGLAHFEEAQREQLLAVPVVGLDRTAARAESIEAVAAAREAVKRKDLEHDATLPLLERRPDLAGLPLRRGKACRLTPSAAAHLDECSGELRLMLGRIDSLRNLREGHPASNKWLKAESVPVLMQMLMAENSEFRGVLAEQLARIEGREATEALAQLALFDLDAGVRARAITALESRPARDYQPLLLRGFEHPWHAVARRAAEALVLLKRKDAVGDLVNLLERPDPRAPYRKPGRSAGYVREMVRVNHLRNCLLCHPASFDDKHKVRGLVPETHLSVDSTPSGYTGTDPGRTFVRADVTYLKQDFSVMLKVADPGKWPEVQRFDFFVRERLAGPEDYRPGAGPGEQHRSVLAALRDLTGHNPGPAAADWKRFLARSPDVWR